MMRVRFLVLLVVTVLLGACFGSEEIVSAEKQVAQFHQLFDAENYHAIYATASNEFKKSSTEAQFVELMQAIHRKLGVVKSSEKQSWFVRSGTGGTTVNLTCKTAFAEGEGIEIFTYRMAGNDVVLLNYNVNSPTLILR